MKIKELHCVNCGRIVPVRPFDADDWDGYSAMCYYCVSRLRIKERRHVR